MPPQSSRVLPVVRALAEVFIAALPDPDAQEVRVGPAAEGSDARQRVYVGWGGDDGDYTMARFTRQWRGAGGQRLTEPFEMPCAVVVWSGDDDPDDLDDDGIGDAFAELLTTAETLFAAVDAALRANIRLGQKSPGVATLTSGAVVPDPGLLRVRIPFVVTYSTQI